MINNQPYEVTRRPCKEHPGVYFRNQQEILQEKYDTYQQKQQLIEAIEAFHASKTPVPDEVLYLNILPYLLHDPQSQIVNDQGLSTLKEAAIRTCRQLEIQLNEHNHNYRQYLEASGNH